MFNMQIITNEFFGSFPGQPFDQFNFSFIEWFAIGKKNIMKLH